MATPLDDSIANLQDFCALLTATHGQLAQYASSLEDQAEQLESRDPEAEQRFGEVREHLQEFGGALENGGRDAGGRLHALEELAAGDDRPAEMAQRLDAAAHAVEHGLESEGNELDGAFGDLRSHGFEALAQAVETARSELRAAVEGAGAACDALEGALAAMRQSLRDEEDAAARVIDEAATALTGGSSQEIARAGDDCVAAWSAEPPGAIEPAAAEAEAALGGLYGDWSASMEAHAAELAGAFQDGCDGAADSGGEQAEQMRAEVEAAPVDVLAGELERAAAVLARGEALMEPLAAMIKELQTVLNVVGSIDGLLAAME